MANRFAKNIDRKGRILRAVCGLILLVPGLVVLFMIPILGIILIISGAFLLFEALRGWCVMRACGIKTRL